MRRKRMMGYREAKRLRLAALKVDRGCVDCGYNANPVAMEFDHVESGKFRTLAVMVCFSNERIDAEVAKCVVRCANCHRRRTRQQAIQGELPNRTPRVETGKNGTAKERRRRHFRNFARRYDQRGREYLASVKLANGCMDCGFREFPEALDFDHVRGEKLFNVSQAIRRPLSILDAEIAKCDIVCANCHAIRTFERGRVAKGRCANPHTAILSNAVNVGQLLRRG
jgi:hypothetical protein